MKKILKFIKKPKLIILYFMYRGYLNFLPDDLYLKLMYKLQFGMKLDLNNPKTFNEKLQWLKLNDRKNIYTLMVDKYEAKKYVAKVIGKEYIIPTINIYNNFDEINFDNLPDKFVIKCTHDSGGIVIANDKTKLDLQTTRKKINKSLKHNYYFSGREWPYKNVKPRIIIEKYMGDNLADYKIHCFNGKAKVILVCTDRLKNLKETFFDTEWNIMPFRRPNHDIDNAIKKTRNLALMIELAEHLSKNIPFLRVDFYEIDGKVYFGELTFFPASGFSKFDPEEWDKKMGDWLMLPKKEW